MQRAGKVITALLLAVGAGAIGSPSAHENKTVLLHTKPKVLNTKAMLHKLDQSHSLAHQKARRNTIQQLVSALHMKKNAEFLANASCGEMVAGTIDNLKYGYTDLQVVEYFKSVCDSYRIYLNFGGPQNCPVIFSNLAQEFENDKDYKKWCTESQALLAGGPAAAAAAPAGAPAGGPGGEWMKPWLAGPEALDAPSPEFFKTCGEIVTELVSTRQYQGRTKVLQNKGKTPKIEEYLTIICSVPKTEADVALCTDFKKTFLEHVHPKDYEWNAKSMDSKLFCNGLYKVLVQHVGFYHAMGEAGPAGAPSGAPAGSPMGAAAPAAPPPAGF